MEFEEYKQQFDASFAKVKPGDFVREMEALGYKFDDIRENTDPIMKDPIYEEYKDLVERDELDQALYVLFSKLHDLGRTGHADGFITNMTKITRPKVSSDFVVHAISALHPFKSTMKHWEEFLVWCTIEMSGTVGGHKAWELIATMLRPCDVDHAQANFIAWVGSNLRWNSTWNHWNDAEGRIYKNADVHGAYLASAAEV